MTVKIVVFWTKMTLVNLLPYQCFTLDTCELNQRVICMNDLTTYIDMIKSEEKSIIADTGTRWEKVLTFEVLSIFAFPVRISGGSQDTLQRSCGSSRTNGHPMR